MKWLATFILSLLTITPLAAQEQKGPAQVPIVMQCLPAAADDMLAERYNEIPFVKGLGVVILANGERISGEFKMYLSINMPNTFSIMFISEPLNCMVMTGNDLEPAANNGQPL